MPGDDGPPREGQATGRKISRCRCPGLMRAHAWGARGCLRPERLRAEVPAPTEGLPPYRIEQHAEGARVRHVRLATWWGGHFPGEAMGQLVPEHGAWEPRLFHPGGPSASKPVGPPVADYELAARQVARAWVEAL